MTSDLPPAVPEPSSSAEDGAGWRDDLAAGRLAAAHRGALADDGAPETVREALGDLSEVERLLRDKAWVRAVKRFQHIEARPEIVDWDVLAGDVDRLRRSGEALDRRQPEAALAELDALTSPFFRAEAETQRGTALIYDDRLVEAAACFQRAIEADPRHVRALTNLGNVALEEGRIDDAIAHYQRALSLDDSFANAHHNLAVAYRRKGQLSKSVGSLKRAQRLLQRRDASDARQQLGSLTRVGGGRLLRWLLYGAAAVVLYLVLHARGRI